HTLSHTQASGPTPTHYDLAFNYNTQTVAGKGSYLQIQGEHDQQVLGGRPVLPITNRVLSTPGAIAHGVLMTGSSFTDLSNFDPLVSQVLTDGANLAGEPAFPFAHFFPAVLASVNRFASIDGTVKQRLVVVPAQYKANRGTEPAPT